MNPNQLLREYFEQVADESVRKKKMSDKRVPAVIRIQVPEFQIGQEVSVYFKDTMSVRGTCERDESSVVSAAVSEPVYDQIPGQMSIYDYEGGK